MMFKHFQFSTIHQSLELVLKAKDIFIKLNNTLILPRVEGRDVQDSRKSLFCSPTPLEQLNYDSAFRWFPSKQKAEDFCLGLIESR